MSALRVSRSAAEESDRIAALQSFAATAAFPAAYSGSTCSFDASSVGSARILAGCRARPRLSRPMKILARITSSVAGQPLFRLAKFGSVAVRVLRQAGQLLEVLTGFLRVSRGLGRLGSPVEASPPHRRIFE